MGLDISDSEIDKTIPQNGVEDSERSSTSSEDLGNVQKDDSETKEEFRDSPERTEDHTITVRDAAKLFEDAAIPITERTIINWCNPNKRGIVRLNCYYDEGPGKYFITPQSIYNVIREESKRVRNSQHTRNGVSERTGDNSEELPNLSEEVPKEPPKASENFRTREIPVMGEAGDGDEEIRRLRQELMDEKILNKGKDFFIEQLQKDRGTMLEQTVAQGRRIGQLETELHLLQGPRQESTDESRETRTGPQGVDVRTAGEEE